MKSIIDLIGRVFLSVIFLFEAYDSWRYWDETQRQMAESGLTWQPDLLLTCGIFALLLGGILLLIGYRTTFGTILLLLYWVPVTLIVHDFWNHPAPELRLQSILFMKNLAVTGGLLIVLVNGSGRYSIKRLLATTRVH
ncbi:MAG: DoxX family protein [Saprospiraceae bacterium]|nr:DoxX family protein [Saprospiraceae bacterium]